MSRFFHKTKGAISVFLVLVLLPVLLLGGLTTDAARIYFSKVTISDAGEMAMNAALANYNAELMDEFGLLVMDKAPESYETEIKEFFNKSLNGTGLGDEEDYARLLDLVAEEVSAVAVKGSQIYYNEVEKQQIIEYMKYRAPLCLVDLVLDKLDAMKDAGKRAEVIKAQMEFSKSAKKCQDAVEAAYEAVDELNRQNEQFATNYPGNGNVRDGAQQVLDYARQNFISSNGIAGAVLKCYALSKYADSAGGGDLESAAESCIEAAEDVDVNRPLETFDDYLNTMYYVNTVDGLGGIDTLLSKWLAENPEPSPAEETIPPVEQTPGSTVTTRETQEHEEWAKTKKEKEDLIEDYKDARTSVSAYPNKLKSATKALIEQELRYVSTLEAYAEDAALAAGNAVEKLEALKDKIVSAQSTWQDWSEKENEVYTAEEEKSSEEYRDLFSEEDNQLFQNLLDKVTHQKDFYTKLQTAVRKEEFLGKKLWKVEAADMYGAAYAKAGSILADVDITSDFTSNLYQYASEYEADYVHVTLAETVDFWQSIAEDRFYKKLQEMNQGGKEPDETKKAEADKQLQDGGDAAKEAQKEDGYPDFDWSSVENADSFLPSHVLANAGGEQADSKLTGADGGTVDKSESENILQKYMDSISAATSFINGLDRILADAMENLYVAEYAMQMCSYYTVDRSLEGEEIQADKVITISGYKLSERKPYKAEAEYILWGNDSSEKNVKYTMMTLYGIRLLFNSFFSFTDSTMCASAQGIATAAFSWAPFMIPITRTLIQLGYAAVEAGNDLSLLKQGYGVAVVKTRDTWATTLYTKAQPRSYTNTGLSLSYAEYLRIFMVLKMMASGNKTTLARIADCIQLKSEFDLTKGYTMVAIDAKVKSRTTFMKKISDLEGGPGTWSYADGYYPIQYQSVLGY